MKLKKLHIFLLFLAVLVFGTLGSGLVEGMENNKESATHNSKSEKKEDTHHLDEVGNSGSTSYNSHSIDEPLTNTGGTYTTAQSGDGPEGVPATSIPPGDEDLYILKSEIVPPVCPACPTTANCPREKPCHLVQCVLDVPNLRLNAKRSLIIKDSNYLPKPVLNDLVNLYK